MIIDPRRPWRLNWQRVSTRWLPFADVATQDIPLSRWIRLALFQVSVGMVMALTVGTLNRVMIVELGVGAWLVALMVALPLLVAPFRAAIGLRSDQHRSPLGWRRVPYVWIGTLLQFGGLAILPFALVLLTGTTSVQLMAGHAATALGFLLAGAGAQIVQTAGLALASDLAAPAQRPRVVALMYVMLLLGMLGAGAVFSLLLVEYTATRLVQVVQGAAVLTVLLNAAAMWKQEVRDRHRATDRTPRQSLRERWAVLAGSTRITRFLVATGLGTAAFNMQDIILEPYGGEVLGLTVGQTSLLTALMAGGALTAFALAARWLSRGADPQRLAACGALLGMAAFSLVIFADPMDSPAMFRIGVVLIGAGGGFFSVGTLTAAMALDSGGLHGMVLGAWGGVVATAAGLSIALGGTLRDVVASLAAQGTLGEVMQSAGAPYGVVYHLELMLLLATLAAIGPLVSARRPAGPPSPPNARFGLAEFPN